MSEQKIARGEQYHIAYQPGSRLYLRLVQNPGVILSERDARSLFESLKEVME